MDPVVQRIFQVFDKAGFEARLVGGCVRDELIGRPIGDRDFATTALPGQTIDILNNSAIKCVPTGIDHGTVTAVIDGVGYEITTLRRDMMTNGRHAVVEFGTDWRADALRRDFTVNALYMDAAGKIYDYTGGGDDIRTKKLRFIGDAQSRIAEDYLRILRYFRFASVLDWAGDDSAALTACRDAAHQLQTLSRERIGHELFKLVSGQGAQRVASTMNDESIWHALLGRRGDTDKLNTIHNGDAFRRLWAIVGNPAILDSIIVLRNIEKKRIAAVERLRALGSIPLAHALYRCGADAVMDRAAVDGVVMDEKTRRIIESWVRPVLPVTAADIMPLAGGAGPRVGSLLATAEDMWIQSDFTLDKNALLSRLN